MPIHDQLASTPHQPGPALFTLADAGQHHRNQLLPPPPSPECSTPAIVADRRARNTQVSSAVSRVATGSTPRCHAATPPPPSHSSARASPHPAALPCARCQPFHPPQRFGTTCPEPPTRISLSGIAIVRHMRCICPPCLDIIAC